MADFLSYRRFTSFSFCAVVSVAVWYDGGATCEADGPRLLASDRVKTDGWEVLDWLGGGGGGGGGKWLGSTSSGICSRSQMSWFVGSWSQFSVGSVKTDWSAWSSPAVDAGVCRKYGSVS